jgi:hypothetical protein
VKPLFLAGLSAAAFAVAFVSFAKLALTQRIHRRVVVGPDVADGMGHDARAVRVTRWTASGGLGISVGLCFVAEGFAFGSLVAVLYAGAAATAVTFVLAYRPRWLRWLLRR